MIDSLGEQNKVARTMYWSTSTVSRDYTGATLPTDDRLRELSDVLGLANEERAELRLLLRQARQARGARQARRKNGPDTPEQEPAPLPASETNPDPAAGPGAKNPRRRWIIAAAAVVFVAAGGVLAWPGAKSGSPPGGVQGTYPGMAVKTIGVPVKSLTPALAALAGRGRTTVTGYEFRNAQDPSLCLTAAGTGPEAGRNGDPVEAVACGLGASQVWIPEQWDNNHSQYTHLVSVRYQDDCLNAQKTGGAMHAGNKTMLWRCYRANNESWDFRDWYQNVKSGRAYPMLTHTDRLCLDASDTYGHAGEVDIRVQRATPSQFWS